jgi:hypothetical protein
VEEPLKRNATGGATTGSVSSSENENEKSKENERMHGVKIAVSGVNRSSSILGNEGSEMVSAGAVPVWMKLYYGAGRRC